MSRLCARSILDLCGGRRPMITPFSEERIVRSGRSWGLSAASYDVRIAHDLTLGPHPGFLLKEALSSRHHWPAETRLDALHDRLKATPPPYALANTIEDFALPDNVAGQVVDKSSMARMFVSAFNTFFDPGFCGNATLELVNLGPHTITLKAGDPVCQFVFDWLDQATDRPYRGKYQNQPKRPVAAIYEGLDPGVSALDP
jgi:dCTP deaminase